jgi:hypothetical protein
MANATKHGLAEQKAREWDRRQARIAAAGKRLADMRKAASATRPEAERRT